MDDFKLGTNSQKYFDNIKKEFSKTEADIEVYINLLEEWAKSQPHFPELPSKNMCRFFIVTCKFSTEKAKMRIDMYYSIRHLMPEIFTVHPLSSDMIRQYKIVYSVILPKVTQKNERVIYIRVNPNYGPEDFVYERILIQFTHVLEVLTQEDCSNNLHFIFDSLGVKLGHIPKFSPVVVKKFAVYFEKVHSNRVASIQLVNFFPFMENIINSVLIPLLPGKIKNRIFADRGTGVLLKSFDKSILPKDVGGEEKSLDELQRMMISKYESLKSRFDKIRNMVTNEKMRPETLKNDDILGYYGSFRQISID